jgi:PTH1 family peptidyl-tRNA hydrolase
MRLRKKKYQAKIAEGKRDGEKLVLAQPQTYMNKSGLAVQSIMAGYGVAPDRIIVVYDDLEVPLGRIRVRPDGSGGTHQGMRSIVRETGSLGFPRLRVGIGPAGGRGDAARFVLSPFSKGELPALEEALAAAEEAAELIFAGRIDEAMNRFNRRGTS